MEINIIRNYCNNKKLRWTRHIFLRMTQRNISMLDVEKAILNGEIIESYPDDYPEPSCLILGLDNDNESLHVVCSIHEGELWLITAYRPNSDMWDSDGKTRKE